MYSIEYLTAFDVGAVLCLAVVAGARQTAVEGAVAGPAARPAPVPARGGAGRPICPCRPLAILWLSRINSVNLYLGTVSYFPLVKCTYNFA